MRVSPAFLNRRLATALALGAELLTTNVRHFPTFGGLRAPY